jgi:hypothetical protein
VAAECLVAGWPQRNAWVYLDALIAAEEALSEGLKAEPARQAFIAAAKEGGVFVREASVRG